MGEKATKIPEDVKNELYASLLVKLCSLQKGATVTTDAYEKAVGGIPFARRTSRNICLEKNGQQSKTTQELGVKRWQ